MKEKFIPILSLPPYKQGDNPNDHAATAASQREYQPAATAATAAPSPAEQSPNQTQPTQIRAPRLITLGIYDIWQMSEVGETLNLIATRRDGKRTMHYCLMFFLVGWLTLGIGWLVWFHKLSSRIGTEQAARGLPVTVTAATYWLWNILGSLIIVGPFIYTYKLLHAMNDLCADYNARG